MAIRKESYAYAQPVSTTSGGFTQRDHVAIEAMKGLLSGITRQELFSGLMEGAEGKMWEGIAKRSYEVADAMIKQSEIE